MTLTTDRPPNNWFNPPSGSVTRLALARRAPFPVAG